MDATKSAVYYYHEATKETSWIRPPGSTPLEPVPAAVVASPSSPASDELPEGWAAKMDETCSVAAPYVTAAEAAPAVVAPAAAARDKGKGGALLCE